MTAPAKSNTIQIPDEYLDCRDLGHAWNYSSANENKKYKNYVRTMVCTRCGTERIQVISQAGYLQTSSYRYASGYLLKGQGKFTTDDRARMRLQNLRRMM